MYEVLDSNFYDWSILIEISLEPLANTLFSLTVCVIICDSIYRCMTCVGIATQSWWQLSIAKRDQVWGSWSALLIQVVCFDLTHICDLDSAILIKPNAADAIPGCRLQDVVLSISQTVSSATSCFLRIQSIVAVSGYSYCSCCWGGSIIPSSNEMVISHTCVGSICEGGAVQVTSSTLVYIDGGRAN